jgi:hypothetical protein
MPALEQAGERSPTNACSYIASSDAFIIYGTSRSDTLKYSLLKVAAAGQRRFFDPESTSWGVRRDGDLMVVYIPKHLFLSQ